MIPRPNRRTGKFVECYTCKKKTYKTKSRLKRYERWYCSIKCKDLSPYKRRVSSERMIELNSHPEYREMLKKKGSQFKHREVITC